MDLIKRYGPSPTIARFHSDDSFVRGVMGPVGSGKSSGCIIEMVSRAADQKPNAKGKRRTRWAIVRNTYRELLDTSCATFFEWFPPGVAGKWRVDEMKFEIRDGDIEADFLFRALDRPKDVKKLLSLDLTGAWLNEVREIPKVILDGMTDRVGRFPPVSEGGASWYGIIMDTNPPDEDHWYYTLAEEETPSTYRFFRQPGGVLEIKGDANPPKGAEVLVAGNARFIANPEAENLDNLLPGYYQTRVPGKKPDHVRIYYCADYGFVSEDKAVYDGEWSDQAHVSKVPLVPVQGLDLLIGLDFGLTPAAIICQKLQRRWHVLRELIGDGLGIQRFGEALREVVNADYPGFNVKIWGDPAGSSEVQTDERTCFEILEALGFVAEAAPSQNPTLRREAVASVLLRMVDGGPAILVDPSCKVLRKGFNGGYHYRRKQIVGEEMYDEKPVKNRWSHPHEALQYVMLGAGEGATLTSKPTSTDVAVARAARAQRRKRRSAWAS